MLTKIELFVDWVCMILAKIKKVMINGGGLLHLETASLIVIILSRGSYLASVIIAVLASLWKELYDRQHGGKFDWRDLVCDAVGILIGSALVLL